MATMTYSFAGKTILVTGGSRGIGRAVVKQLASAGARVVFTYSKDREAAETLLNETGNDSSRVSCVQADFTDRLAVARMIANLLEEGPVHGVVNNAGILRDTPMYRMADEQWDTVLQVNLTSLHIILKNLIRPLAASRGSVVNLSSVTGIAGAAGQTNYAASKAGVIGLTKALAKEAGPLGIRVNAVAPGFIGTDMLESIPARRKRDLEKDIPLRRLGTPEEAASAVLFLLSEEASYINGAVLVVDGGLL
ncbi:3-ketoacyl-ACP reductase [Paenibacillus chitinolyticus]|uniref:SDR family oxidoreductase n=1 Tax=Paenibacillus chitinolyticus TaxID=79263 RepID=UPI0026E4B221|nr:SDR family NAD(P)-dependent oxidoreductase [Paenibacillus chitinolyticus]GKS10745.1 3-ketoacyl-ACP reductase [Paenibacillus chitinolyticus]